MPRPPFDDIWTVTDLNRRHLLEGGAALFFHARRNMARNLVEGKFALMHALAQYAAGRGIRVEVLTCDDASRGLIDDPRHLHVFMEDVPIYGANCFHAVPAYLRGHWYFDELASRNNSSHRLRRFDPRSISGKYAGRVFEKLQRDFVARNFSKFAQPDRGSAAVPGGCLAFFAQTFDPPRYYRDYMTGPQMLEALLAARGRRPVCIKPHPRQTGAEREYLQGLHAPEEGVHVVEASIHDLLEAADVAVTLTSAVAFEGFLHRTPAVLGGQTDFARNAITLTDPGRMAEAIEAALAQNWEYEKFLTWFLKKNCVEDRPQGLDEVLERIHRKGFVWADQDRTGFF